jgi:hypothetical protein
VKKHDARLSVGMIIGPLVAAGILATTLVGAAGGGAVGGPALFASHVEPHRYAA